MEGHKRLSRLFSGNLPTMLWVAVKASNQDDFLSPMVQFIITLIQSIVLFLNGYPIDVFHTSEVSIYSRKAFQGCIFYLFYYILIMSRETVANFVKFLNSHPLPLICYYLNNSLILTIQKNWFFGTLKINQFITSVEFNLCFMFNGCIGLLTSFHAFHSRGNLTSIFSIFCLNTFKTWYLCSSMRLWKPPQKATNSFQNVDALYFHGKYVTVEFFQSLFFFFSSLLFSKINCICSHNGSLVRPF